MTATISFTICSNNYLAHAKTLADSFLQFNPESPFIVGLVDKKSEDIDYSFLGKANLIELSDDIIPGYKDMMVRYNIVELNTAVKPFFFNYLIKTYSPDFIHYFDPDVKIYQSIASLNGMLYSKSLLL